MNKQIVGTELVTKPERLPKVFTFESRIWCNACGKSVRDGNTIQIALPGDSFMVGIHENVYRICLECFHYFSDWKHEVLGTL